MWTLLFAYVLGGLTFIPLVILGLIIAVLYLTPPVGDSDSEKLAKRKLLNETAETTTASKKAPSTPETVKASMQGWVTIRRTFEETATENATTYVGNVLRSFLESKQAGNNANGTTSTRRPRDTFYAVLKSSVLYLYEDEACTECHAALGVSSYDVRIWPDGLLDGELFAKRNGIRLMARNPSPKQLPVLSKDMKLGDSEKVADGDATAADRAQSKAETDAAREEAFDLSRPYFMFVKSNTQMEDWYLALVHASTSDSDSIRDPLAPLSPVFSTSDMSHLVQTLDLQPDPIPMRWLNALLGRLFFSLYKTDFLESFFIGRIMKKISKVPRPAFLSDLVVREVSIGHTAPFFSKPMLKELTKEGDASIELGLSYKAHNPSTTSYSKLKGEPEPPTATESNAKSNSTGLESGGIRIIVEATVTINLNIKSSLPLNLGSRFDFKPMNVKIILAVVLRALEGNLLVKIKRPPSNRIWYGFTSAPKMELELLPIVSDRKIKWGLILKPIENLIREVIQESIVLPNMDDIPFFDTDDYPIRGGIFADAVRTEYDFTSPSPAANGSPQTLAKPSDTNGLPHSERQTPSPEPRADFSQSADALVGNSIPQQEPEPYSKEQSTSLDRVGTSISLPVTPKSALLSTPAPTAPTSKKPFWLTRFGAQANDSTSTLASASATTKDGEDTTPPQPTQELAQEANGDAVPERPVTPLNEVQTSTADVEQKAAPVVVTQEPSARADDDSSSKAEDVDALSISQTMIGAFGLKEKAATVTPATSSKLLGNTRKRSPTMGHHTTQSAAANFFTPPAPPAAPVPPAATGALNAAPSPSPAPPPRSQTRSPSPPRQASTSTSSPPRTQSPTPAAAFIAAWKNTKTGADKQALVAAAARDAMRKWGFGAKKDSTPPPEPAVDKPRSSTDRPELVPPVDAARARTVSSSSRVSNANGAAAGGYWGEDEEGDATPQPNSSNGPLGTRKPTPDTSLKPPSMGVATPIHPAITNPTEEQPNLTLTPSRSPQLSASPMHVRQPGQAAMMRIPGIHSSHKGEVMSMGSTPQPPTLTLPPQATEEGGGLGPKLQSVYRLFQPRDAPTASNVTPSGSSEPSDHSSLPKERTSVDLKKEEPETSNAPSSKESGPETHLVSSSPTNSASAALKHIASLDELSRRRKADERSGETQDMIGRRSSLATRQSPVSPSSESSGDQRIPESVQITNATEPVGALNSKTAS